MTTRSNEPWVMLNDLGRELNRALISRQVEQANPTKSWIPSVDIRETEESYQLSMDLPGVDPKNIEVSMDNDVLEISGERKSEHDGAMTNGYQRRERQQGSFKRRFKLPQEADTTEISASSEHGVLQVLIKKRSDLLPRKITVN